MVSTLNLINMDPFIFIGLLVDEGSQLRVSRRAVIGLHF